MDILILALAIFIPSVLFIELLMYALRLIVQPDRQSVRRRVKRLAAGQLGTSAPGLLRTEKYSELPALHKIISFIPVVSTLERYRKQANTKYPLSVFILISLVMTLTAYLILSRLFLSPVIPVLCAVLFAAAPWVYLYGRKSARMKKFQKQLPEALDLIARSLKAGHAFTSGLKLTADQFDDPLGKEFEETVNEINFGVSVSEALTNLVGRIDCPDLRFFVVSVILQRETGGNLAEIMENSARLIRERFKFQNHVRTLAAEGKFSAVILIAIPVFVFIVLYIINYEYMSILVKETAGNIMLGIAGFMIITGLLLIRKIINIKV